MPITRVPRGGRIVGAALVCLSALAPAAHAGPINPPAGPIAPTHKTMSQVEPRTPIGPDTTPGDADSLYKITTPGSYYLTGNLTGSNGKHGIEIAVTGVTIDLMGFTLTGPSVGPMDAITFTGGVPTDITVRNGFIRNWGRDGVNILHHGGGQGVTVENLTISSCGSTGIATAWCSTVRSCTVSSCAEGGIVVGNRSLVENCVVVGAGGSAALNAGDACTVRGCTITASDGAGVWIGERCAVTGCGISDNGAEGITAWGADTVISRCIIDDNAGSGIVLLSGCAAIGNTCAGNGAPGSGAAGIYVQGERNRVEDNTLRANRHGLFVSGHHNLIFRNTAAANQTNYFINISNRYGVVVDLTGETSQTVSGNSGAGTMFTVDPWANVAF